MFIVMWLARTVVLAYHWLMSKPSNSRFVTIELPSGGSMTVERTIPVGVLREFGERALKRIEARRAARSAESGSQVPSANQIKAPGSSTS